jgi:four helix bundle protein
MAIYATTDAFPTGERYELTREMRRTAVSVAANIAEGCGRSSRKEFRRFLDISMGSASELEYFLILARDLGLLPSEAHPALHERVTEVKRMLTGLIKRLKTEP